MQSSVFLLPTDERPQDFCKETVLWKNISHPNILGLIAVDIDSFTGRCSMISELMMNGNIMTFIQHTSVNRIHLVIDSPVPLPLSDSQLILLSY
jgi:hypothetical protein